MSLKYFHQKVAEIKRHVISDCCAICTPYLKRCKCLLYHSMESGANGQSLSSLVSSIDTLVAETASQIDVITQATKSLVPLSEYEELIKDSGAGSAVPFDHEALIIELEKLRLELVMSIQQQNFATTKLQEMIGESQELVQSVQEHYATREENTQAEEAAAKERLKYYEKNVVGPKLQQLDLNLLDFDEKFHKLEVQVTEALRNIQDGRRKALSAEYQESLTTVIGILSDTFNYYVRE